MASTTFPTRVLAPIVATARRLDWSERRAFLDDLRRDAPMLVAEVERVLTAGAVSAPEQAIAPWPALIVRLRQFASRSVFSRSIPLQRQNGAD